MALFGVQRPVDANLEQTKDTNVSLALYVVS